MEKKFFLHRSHSFKAEQGDGGHSKALLPLPCIPVTNTKANTGSIDLPVIPLCANFAIGLDIPFFRKVGDSKVTLLVERLTPFLVHVSVGSPFGQSNSA